MRPYSASSLGMTNKVDMDELRANLHKKAAKWFDTAQLMPCELLLVFRNQNYLRSLNYEMGQPVNRFRVMARMAVRGSDYRNPIGVVEQQRVDYQHTWNKLTVGDQVAEVRRRGWLSAIWERVEFEWSLAYADVVQWVGKKLFWLWASDEMKAELYKQAEAHGEKGNALFGG